MFYNISLRSTMHSTEQTKMIKNLCKICGVTVSYTNFARHMQSHNEEAKVKCDICDQSFKTSNSLYQHMKVHRKPEEVVCNLCEKVVFSRSALSKHHKTQHELILFLCPYCQKHFTTKDYCRKHSKNRDIPKTSRSTVD